MSPSVISCQPRSSHPPPPQSPASLPPARTNIISENTARCWPRALHLYATSRSAGAAHTFYTLALFLSRHFFFTSIQILKYPSRAIQSYVLCCICRAAERFYNVYFYYYTLSRLKCARCRLAPCAFIIFANIRLMMDSCAALQLLVIDTQFMIISSEAISALEHCFF